MEFLLEYLPMGMILTSCLNDDESGCGWLSTRLGHNYQYREDTLSHCDRELGDREEVEGW